MRNLIQCWIMWLARCWLLSSVCGRAWARRAHEAEFWRSRGFVAKSWETLATRGPAPRRDLTGFWAGKVVAKLNAIPPMTPWGQEQFRLHKTNGEYPVAESNDPIKGCDPLGFPRNMLFMTRGIVFTSMPGKTIEMSEYNRVWREIWTDGRELPKNVGGRSADAPDPRWYGYSVGHWEDDYTFVVNTVGSDERTWLDNSGHPHSIDLRVEETLHASEITINSK